MAPTMLSNSMILADAIVVEENGKKISDSFTTDSKLLAKASKSSKVIFCELCELCLCSNSNCFLSSKHHILR